MKVLRCWAVNYSVWGGVDCDESLTSYLQQSHTKQTFYKERNPLTAAHISVDVTLLHNYSLSNIQLKVSFSLSNHFLLTGCPSHLYHPCCTSTKENWSSGKIWLWNYIHLYFLTVPTVISPKSNKCHHSSHKPASSDLRGRGKFNSLWCDIHLSQLYSLIEL